VILEAIIAGSDITIDGVRIAHDAVYAALPIPLLREHRTSDAVGEVYHLQRRGADLIAFCETDDAAAAYTHVSPGLRVLSHDRMKLIEVSLVQQPKSSRTQIVRRTATDPARDYARLKRQHTDLLIRRFQLLQQLVRTLHATHS
jgi:hypothetical protein